MAPGLKVVGLVQGFSSPVTICICPPFLHLTLGYGALVPSNAAHSPRSLLPSPPPCCLISDEIVSTLGEGTFGRVVQCVDHRR